MTNLKEEREAIVEAIKDYDENVGWVCYPDDVATALLSHEEKVVARVRETIRKERLTWVKGSIGDNALESLELALTLPITDKNV